MTSQGVELATDRSTQKEAEQYGHTHKNYANQEEVHHSALELLATVVLFPIGTVNPK
jgi:hypothetical protein